MRCGSKRRSRLDCPTTRFPSPDISASACRNGASDRTRSTTSRLCDIVKTGDEATLDFDNDTITVNGQTYNLKPLGEVRPVIDAGGLFNFARESGMIAKA